MLAFDLEISSWTMLKKISQCKKSSGQEHGESWCRREKTRKYPEGPVPNVETILIRWRFSFDRPHTILWSLPVWLWEEYWGERSMFFHHLSTPRRPGPDNTNRPSSQRQDVASLPITWKLTNRRLWAGYLRYIISSLPWMVLGAAGPETKLKGKREVKELTLHHNAYQRWRRTLDTSSVLSFLNCNGVPTLVIRN